MSDELVARARAMHQQGRTIREIAQALKHPKSTIGRELASQKVDAPVVVAER